MFNVFFSFYYNNKTQTFFQYGNFEPLQLINFYWRHLSTISDASINGGEYTFFKGTHPIVFLITLFSPTICICLVHESIFKYSSRLHLLLNDRIIAAFKNALSEFPRRTQFPRLHKFIFLGKNEIATTASSEQTKKRSAIIIVALLLLISVENTISSLCVVILLDRRVISKQ